MPRKAPATLADEIPRGALRAVVLALLAEAPLHGYGIVQLLKLRTGDRVEIPEGSLYPALHELELEGLIDATWEKSPEGRRRRVYSLTSAGRKETTSSRDRWLAMAELLKVLLVPPAPRRA